MTMPGTKDNLKALRNRGSVFLQKLRQVDKKAGIIPWKAAHRHKPTMDSVQGFKKIPDLFAMDMYFNRAKVLQRIDMSTRAEFARDMWYHVFLKHEEQEEGLLNTLNATLKGSQMHTQLTPIQHENPQLLGYLLFSTISTDIPNLNKSLF